ncbi:MAG: Rieske (2Fe-2S) protein [Pseudomonadota bacterium]
MQNSDANPQKTVRCQLLPRNELATDQAVEVRLGDGDWPLRVIVVDVAGELRIFRNRCPHLAWPLNVKPDAFLTADGQFIVCQGHGALFERGTGSCVAGPCRGQALRQYTAATNSNGIIVADVPVSDLPFQS